MSETENTDNKQKANPALRSLLLTNILLGGPEFITGIERIMDGQCPDCGELDEDDHKCLLILDPK